jgi:hypothetical protein
VPVASPSLLFQVTPPGGVATDYSRYLAYSGAESEITINQNFGRQGDTATFVLVDEFVGTPHVIVQPMSQVSLFDAVAGQTLFAGVCHTPDMLVDGPLRREWNLGCTDYSWYGDNAIVQGTFYGMSVDQIVIALTLQANCGITAAPLNYGGGFVAPGPVLPSCVITYRTLTEAYRKLAQLAGQSTPYGWYVDDRLRLHFYDATTAVSSGVTFTTSPTAGGAGSLTEGHFGLDGSCRYTWDGASVRNRTLVQGATQTITVPTTGSPTDKFRSDGVATSWPLRYVLTGSPLLQVGGAFQNLTIVSGGQQVTVSGWTVQQNARGGWFLTTSSAPQAGTTIKIWYNYQVPIVAQANSYPSQATYLGPNRGIYSEFISDTSLTTMPMALARAQRQRNEYAFAAERLSWTATEEFMGWVRAGQTCLVTNQWMPDARAGYALGLTNAPFLVIGNQITFTRGGYRQMAITGIRL